jgi:hypothetical protein
MKKHKRLSRSEALGKIATAPVTKSDVAPVDTRTGLRRFTDEFNAEEKQRAEAPVRAAEAALSESLRALRQEQANSLLSGTSDEFLSRTTPITDDEVIVDGKPIEIPVVRQRIQNAFHAAVLKLEDEGVRFTDAGLKRLQDISLLAPYRSVNWMLAGNWQTLFTLADEVGLMTERECSRQVIPTVTQEQPTDLLAELELQPATDAGRRRAKELGDLHFFSVECREVFIGFLNHCAAHWDFYPTEHQMKIAVQWFTDNNRSMISDKTAWDEMKRNLISRAIFPRVSPTGKSLLNEDELLCEAIDNAAVPVGSFAARQDFARRTQALKDQQ